jgi:hypothetical protein
MVPPKRLLAAAVLVAALAPARALALSAPSTSGKPTLLERELLHSHELWATIDVCNTSKQPDTIGIRGSMPGDRRARDRMYMAFRLQYLNAQQQWVNLAGSASSAYVAVGSGASSRQGGTSFELKPVAGKPPVTLRGVVDFEWRRGKTVVMLTAEPTSAAHRSLAGAEPADYSAATCVIG